jgi:hypothetical protein
MRSPKLFFLLQAELQGLRCGSRLGPVLYGTEAAAAVAEVALPSMSCYTA